MMYFFGLITGLVVAILLIVIDGFYRRSVSSRGVVGHFISKMDSKGEIIESQPEEMTDWLGKLPNE